MKYDDLGFSSSICTSVLDDCCVGTPINSNMHLLRRFIRNCIVACGLSVCSPANAHPHVFVDGGVDFVLRDSTVLEAVQVTWVYDEFETLYLLSSYGMSLNASGELDEQDRLRLVALHSDWPSDFDGSAHLSVDHMSIALAWPEGLDVHLIEGHLKLTFSRRLETPIDLRASTLHIGFYEATYFFAFRIANPPKLLGASEACTAKVVPFVADEADTALQSALSRLSREEAPADTKVGALFADKIVLRCA